jgi:predicted 2-oxoglutarate/Fe(II)-dependent dioxygenase YbiX
MAGSIPASLGASAPMTHGVFTDGVFFSLDSQAGRPLALALVGRLPMSAAREALAALQTLGAEFAEIGADLIALLDIESPVIAEFAEPVAPSVRFVLSRREVFDGWKFSSGAPRLVGLDRAGRIAFVSDTANLAACAALLASLAALPRERPHDDPMPAPVLAVPNIVSLDFCGELIAHFEASAHSFGGMAAVDASGQFAHKVDGAKKHRFDYVLGPRDPLLNRVLAAIVMRCAPEIKRAFQVEIAHTDRILLARYDDSGGYFKRHRDNAASSVAFRQFALTINLNDDYDGGAVMFPEYNDRRYRPGAGAGVVFSCSLLHEALPVTRGRRYCALTFVHDAGAQARWLAAGRLASA